MLAGGLASHLPSFAEEEGSGRILAGGKGIVAPETGLTPAESGSTKPQAELFYPNFRDDIPTASHPAAPAPVPTVKKRMPWSL